MRRSVLGTGLAILGLALGAAAARAGDTGDKIKNGAEHVGGTVEHGAKSVGLGATRLYHRAAQSVHKSIARHSGDETKKKEHMADAAKHSKHASKSARLSGAELRRAGREAGRVTP